MSVLHVHSLVGALLQSPSHRTFITMWHDEDDVQRVSFGKFIYVAKLHADFTQVV